MIQAFIYFHNIYSNKKGKYYYIRFKYLVGTNYIYTYDIETQKTGRVYEFETMATIDSEKVESFIDRNAIIHGDYYSDLLDITQYDVIKLMLLYLNMRMISDHIQHYCEMLRECINYTEVFFAQKAKESCKKEKKKGK